MNTKFSVGKHFVQLFFLFAFLVAPQLIHSQSDFLTQLPPSMRADVMSSMGTDMDTLNDQNEREAKDRKNVIVQDIPSLVKSNKEINLSNIERYGVSLFKKNNLYFRPVQNVELDDTYQVGVGDQIQIKTFGQIEVNNKFKVERDGNISIPQIGSVYALKSLRELKDSITALFDQSYVATEVFVSISDVKDINVFVMGAVDNPGSYLVNSLSSAINVLNIAGGISDYGSLRSISVIRKNKIIADLDFYDPLINGKNLLDIQLRANDTLFVRPAKNLVSIYGAVNRPAIYELLENETANDLINFAQGFDTKAAKDSVSITSLDSEGISSTIMRSASSADSMGPMQPVSETIIPFGANVFVPFMGTRSISSIQLKGAFFKNVNLPESEFNKNKTLYLNENLTNKTYPLFFIVNSNGVYHYLNIDQFEDHKFVAGDLVYSFSKDDLSFIQHPIVSQALSGKLSSERLNQIRRVVGLQMDVIEDSKSVTESVGSLMNPMNADAFLEDIDYQPGNDLLAKIKQQDEIINMNRANCSSIEYLASVADTNKGKALWSKVKNFTSSMNKPFVSEDSTNPINENLAFDYQLKCPRIFDSNHDLIELILSNSVKLIGDVVNPGLYPVSINSKADQLVGFAGGYSVQSDSVSVEVTNTGKLVTGTSLTINPSDVVNVRSNLDFQNIEPIRLTGEFNRPGQYIVTDNERLSDVIRRAGGYTENAFPFGGVLIRRSALEREKEALDQAYMDIINSITTAISTGKITQSADSLLNLVQQFKNAKPSGRIITEFSLSRLARDKNLDIFIEPGDFIYMPRTKSSVTVVGEVLRPVTLPHTDRMKARSYIDLAGGIKSTGDKSSIYVVLPNGEAKNVGTSILSFSSVNIIPGSTIFVPRNPAPFSSLQVAANIAPVLSSLALTAASLNSISD